METEIQITLTKNSEPSEVTTIKIQRPRDTLIDYSLKQYICPLVSISIDEERPFIIIDTKEKSKAPIGDNDTIKIDLAGEEEIYIPTEIGEAYEIGEGEHAVVTFKSEGNVYVFDVYIVSFQEDDQIKI